ncbi:MAG: SufE family protein [Acidimicrobiia bacterium]|nr:SufE family protein [Acidimicrobiia bacterium]MBT8215835.1 SufE family protein [Acidimicrobiia bacterium]NNF10996.1 SufE family protein [Acidimicrobiia bacterium]NNL68858.1 SufE family protein [Acidimicrobiia bacterium]
MPVPPQLQRIVDLFASAPENLLVPALLDYVDKIPPLPDELSSADALERVQECQSPFFVATRVDDGRVSLYFDAPKEAPTTRSYAGILYSGLNGATVEEILDVPSDFYLQMGLGRVITPLRLRGMSAILATIKRQVREHAAA